MFTGFSDQTIDFMWGIRFNNEKPWFEAHKEDYLRYFYTPMKELGNEIYALVDRRHPELELVHKTSRIYRDARRLRGRGPYKDRLWCSIERPGDGPDDNWAAKPLFWFELEPEGYSYGLGYYCARPVTMLKFRTRLDKNPAPFVKMVKQFNRQSQFVLDSDCYKKPKGNPPEILADWYNSKGFSLVANRRHDALLFSADLPQVLADAYETLMPFYEYLSSVDRDPDPRDPA